MNDPLLLALHESRQLGFLGPGPVEAHVQHALAFADLAISSPARALDLGAGGGLPGLVLAMLVWPETAWTFLDSQQRRTAFLQEASEALGISERVQVVTGRAEDVCRLLDFRGSYDLVVARSFGAPAVTAECAAPLLRAGGSLIVSEPPATESERWPADGLSVLDLVVSESVVVSSDGSTEPVHLVRLERGELELDRYPRRVGIPAKRPIF